MGAEQFITIPAMGIPARSIYADRQQRVVDRTERRAAHDQRRIAAFFHEIEDQRFCIERNKHAANAFNHDGGMARFQIGKHPARGLEIRGALRVLRSQRRSQRRGRSPPDKTLSSGSQRSLASNSASASSQRPPTTPVATGLKPTASIFCSRKIRTTVQATSVLPTPVSVPVTNNPLEECVPEDCEAMTDLAWVAWPIGPGCVSNKRLPRNLWQRSMISHNNACLAASCVLARPGPTLRSAPPARDVLLTQN